MDVTPVVSAIIAFCQPRGNKHPNPNCERYMRACVDTRAKELWAQGFGWDKEGLMRDCKIEWGADGFREPFNE